jgi:type III secretory pathway component EscS
MTPADVTEVVLDGLWLSLQLLLPFMVLAAGAAAGAGALCRLLGLVDPTLSRVLKGLCVMAALVPGVAWIGKHSEDFASSTWAAMAEVDGSSSKAR